MLKVVQMREGPTTKQKWLGLIVGGLLLIALAAGGGWYAWQRTRPQSVANTPLDAKTATPASATKDSDLQKDLDDISRSIGAYDNDDKTFSESLVQQEPELQSE